MQFTPGICPACNGQIPLPSGRESIRCMYCGAEVRTDQAAALASTAPPLQQPPPFSPGSIPPSSGLSTNVKIAIGVAGAVVLIALISIAGVIVLLRPSRMSVEHSAVAQKPAAAPSRPVPSPAQPSVQSTPSGDTTDSDDSSDSDDTTNSDDSMSGLLTKLAGDGAASSTSVLANLDEAAASKITYPMLKKDADRYSGQAWAFKGKVLQIFEHGEHTEARIGLDGWGNNVMWVEGNFTTDFVENNVVWAIGYLAGSYTYKSQAGWDITIPSLAARAMLSPQALAKMKTEATPKTKPDTPSHTPVREAARGGQGTTSEKDHQDKVSKAERLLNQ